MLLFFVPLPLPLHFDRLICRKSGKFLQFCRIAHQNHNLPCCSVKTSIVPKLRQNRKSA